MSKEKKKKFEDMTIEEKLEYLNDELIYAKARIEWLEQKGGEQ